MVKSAYRLPTSFHLNSNVQMGNNISRIKLTFGRVDAFTCPDGKSQAFLWDKVAPSLLLRVTPTGRKTYAFEGRLNGQTIRFGIGTVADWTLEKARQRATELKMLVDAGQDPRELERQQQRQRETRRLQEHVEATTLGEAWAVYIEERRPFWGDLHYQSHIDKACSGGVPSKRRGMTNKLTRPGPLATLMPLTLKSLDTATIETWAKKEGKTRPTSARLAWRLLSVFLNWCAEHPQYATAIPDRNPAKSRKAREAFGKANVKDDVLTREQLPAWFSAVRQIGNPTIATALQTMLLTGARPSEVLTLRWEDVNTQWRGLTIRDKVEGERQIPLTPYVAKLLATLPRRNEWVFASARLLKMDTHNSNRRRSKAAKRGIEAPLGDIQETSKSGYITKPNTPHARACRVAGLEGLTLHGLRRSFSSLTEWLDIPAGVVAQIQGHKPSATAEKHYKRRPLDLLRAHHERIEAWILEQAGIQFDDIQQARSLQIAA